MKSELSNFVFLVNNTYYPTITKVAQDYNIKPKTLMTEISRNHTVHKGGTIEYKNILINII